MSTLPPCRRAVLHALADSPQAIVELGRALADQPAPDPATLAPVSEFQTFVRPFVHAHLTPFCTELTTITQAA